MSGIIKQLRKGEAPLAASYVLPIASHVSQVRDLSGYLRRLSRIVDDVIVVDGSGVPVFDAHACAWGSYVRHLPPILRTTNGKVAGVMTGVSVARYEAVIVADDDIRYRAVELRRMIDLLSAHDVVRPQNSFKPLPWHARWDTARSLLNRLLGGDWPGTLGVRRSVLLRAGGYSGDVLFENLEMVRTVKAASGRETVALDLIIARRPPSTGHFLSQRTRQAYDEWARPAHFTAQLALLPLGVWITRKKGMLGLAALATASVIAAEAGRRRGGGHAAFPATSALWAPAWLAERSVTSWSALFSRLVLGGVRYRDARLKRAATPQRELRARIRDGN